MREVECNERFGVVKAFGLRWQAKRGAALGGCDELRVESLDVDVTSYLQLQPSAQSAVTAAFCRAQSIDIFLKD